MSEKSKGESPENPAAKKSTMRKIELSETALEEFRKRKDVRSNIVRTSKYTWYNFFFINLFE